MKPILILLTVLIINSYAELQWDIGQLASCSYIYGRSVRERSRQQQEDPLFLWIGKPSEALQVSSKHGRLPIISLWRSYVNVLYLTECLQAEQLDAATVVTFMLEWMKKTPALQDRSLFIGGTENHLSNAALGGLMSSCAMELLSAKFNLAGVLIGKPRFQPSARFFAHRPFETGNQMNEYAITRAFNPVACNSLNSQVEFVMNDAIFYYAPTSHERAESANEMHEYMLKGVSSYDTCYKDLNSFEQEWAKRSPYLSYIFPALPQAQHSFSPAPFPLCDSTDVPDDFAQLLRLNLTVFMYSFIYKEVKPICSFYIGIFKADGVKVPEFTSISGQGSIQSQSTISSFNAAPLEDIEDSWTRYADEHTVNDKLTFTQLGQIQDAGSVEHFNGQQRLIWMHLDSRMDLKRKTGLLMLSKLKAVDILSRLMHESIEIEYVDLFLQ